MKIAKFLDTLFENLKALKGNLLESKEKKNGMFDFFKHQIHPYNMVRTSLSFSLSVREYIKHEERLKRLSHIIKELQIMSQKEWQKNLKNYEQRARKSKQNIES